MLNQNQAFLLVQNLKSAPKAEKKGYHRIREANLQPLDVNVVAFISNLGAKQQAKNAQNGPKFFPHSLLV